MIGDLDLVSFITIYNTELKKNMIGDLDLVSFYNNKEIEVDWSYEYNGFR